MPDHIVSLMQQCGDLDLHYQSLRFQHHALYEQHIDYAVELDTDLFTSMTGEALGASEWTLVASSEGQHQTRGLFAGRGPTTLEVVLSATVTHGAFSCSVSATTPEGLRNAVELITSAVPKRDHMDRETIPVTFWTNTEMGPRSMSRDLDADHWHDIEGNYPGGAEPLLSHMITGPFEPGVGGQLLLWHGVPGTGKTTALRSLAREWRGWCDLHYIVDPEEFFGRGAAYMMSVLLAGDDHDGVVDLSEPASEPRWRLLVLEDCGEMLQPDARREVGQALSRLLNACDGMIGRGLRIMVLLTTNEPLDKLHEAVARPGRCAMRVEFGEFDGSSARDWLEEHDASFDALAEIDLRRRYTLADLYGHLQHFQTRSSERAVGFR